MELSIKQYYANTSKISSGNLSNTSWRIICHILEIPNFLSPEECDDIIRLAQKQGLVRSSTMDENLFEDEEKVGEDQRQVFEYYDYNKDDLLDIDEVSDIY